MSKFKRVPLTGSDELFRPTAGPAAGESGADATRAGETTGPAAPAVEKLSVSVTRDELKSVVEALQLARFPESRRPRPTMTEFEALGALQERLREHLNQDS